MKTNKIIKVLIVTWVVLSMAFSGCTAKNEQTIKTPGGDVKVSEGSGPYWCKTGTTVTAIGPYGKEVSYTIKGITNYEGKEVCESDLDSSEDSYKIYMNQDKTYRVMIITDKDGKETKINIVNKTVNIVNRY
jgi:hypothetical protein